MSKKKIILLFFICIHYLVQSQECNIRLSGYILDQGTNIALPYSSIYAEDAEKGAVTNDDGYFELEGLCPGEQHLEFSHIGCQPEHHYYEIMNDSVIYIYLHHHTELLDEVLVHGHHADNTSQSSNTLAKADISKESNKNLSDILENLTGVSTIKNGSGISKPVVHGLSGNRVAILNNGIAQSGQQWGNDHAPEIDPFVADHISVIKGASALAYGSNSLGSIILVEAGDINEDPHLQGRTNYIFQTNGLGHTLNTQLEKNDKWAAWRVTGTLKVSGDTKTPNHFLTNTGKREGNVALQLEKEIGSWHHQFYYSIFNTTIGVLRGSHIGNLTDLELALNNEVPYFTVDTFSYAINAPRQEVKHHLAKLESKFFIDDERVFKLKYGGQWNNRKEYDIRRGGRSNIPALSLNQYNHFFEGAYQQSFSKNWLLKTGLQYNLIDNANEPGTGINPLIPRYKLYSPALYLISQKESDNWFYEIGGRYDFKQLNVTTIRNGIEHFQHQFHNFGISTGAKYRWNNNLKSSLNIGFMSRAPEINELYSFGLHQGVSGIEEGNRTLEPEKSFKAVLSSDLYIDKKLFIQGLAYYQKVDDFIYLQPQNDFRLTIRGAFPVFLYQQTNARISGMDWQLTYEPFANIKFINKYSLVRGYNLTDNKALINLPSDNISSSIHYTFLSNDRFKNSFISINGKYIWRQNRIMPEQDFVAPPDAYFLLGANLGTTIQLNESRLELQLRVENALNQNYRDYLNRLRYFADETGFNISLRASYIFVQ